MPVVGGQLTHVLNPCPDLLQLFLGFPGPAGCLADLGGLENGLRRPIPAVGAAVPGLHEKQAGQGNTKARMWNTHPTHKHSPKCFSRL